MLRIPQLKPYIIYIKPPPFDVLKETRNAAYARSTFDENNSRGFTVSMIALSNDDTPLLNLLSVTVPCEK
jgi:hypothetical protein